MSSDLVRQGSMCNTARGLQTSVACRLATVSIWARISRLEMDEGLVVMEG